MTVWLTGYSSYSTAIALQGKVGGPNRVTAGMGFLGVFGVSPEFYGEMVEKGSAVYLRLPRENSDTPVVSRSCNLVVLLM